jgi:GT2 family glycosyltransferase
MNFNVVQAGLLLLGSFYRSLSGIFKTLLGSIFSGHFAANIKLLGRKIRDFNDRELMDFPRQALENTSLDSPAMQKCRERSRGLHQLLPDTGRFKYSILIPVYKPKALFFEKALIAALDQSAPHLEVLVGYDGPQPEAVYDVVRKLRAKDPRYASILREVHCKREVSGGGISRTTNELALAATGTYLLLMDHDDWIRPDLLFRYEQTLRLLEDPEKFVLYCNEYKINEKDEVIQSSYIKKPERPIFPYLFINYICHCLLVPTTLWKKVGGLRPECDGAQDYDISLRLDVTGAEFQNVPFFLYAWRSHAQSTAKSMGQKDYATPAGVRAMKDYARAKGLDWEVSAGYFPTSYRAVPKLEADKTIHAIIPYKEQKALTIKAIQSLQSQKGVSVVITAIDNGSSDLTIAQELRALGVEVLTLNEPFNYSRINNYGVKNSRYHASSDILLFMNNDVELEECAVLEMLRWIGQPKVGIVGARLHYPSGLLQHGGVDLSDDGMGGELTWRHTNNGMRFQDLNLARVIRTSDAVTAACAMIEKDVFLKVGGFDEVFYPIAYSDTDLCNKIRKIGLHSLYTPYAFGTHYESVTRHKSTSIEDVERSYWLYVNAQTRSGNARLRENSKL